MARITSIVHKPDRERFWIFVDGEYCVSIRERTFPAMGLSVGDEITCEKIKELEKFHWKNQYGAQAWEKEQVRLERVKTILESIDERVLVNIVGFGANTTEFLAEHPNQSGAPDLEVLVKDKPYIRIMLVEVTGTETRRGADYWVRPDKLEYARNNPQEDVWIVLHYANPKELVVFIRPDNNKQYVYHRIEIRGSTEHYVTFNNMSPEVKSYSQFSSYLRTKIEKLA